MVWIYCGTHSMQVLLNVAVQTIIYGLAGMYLSTPGFEAYLASKHMKSLQRASTTAGEGELKMYDCRKEKR